MADSTALFRKIYPEEFYSKFLEHNIRPDERKLGAYRKVTIAKSVIGNCDGSALVKIGKTAVIAGARVIVAPHDEKIDSNVIVNVEMTPICSPKYKPGKPHEDAAFISSSINNILKSSNCVDFSNLKVSKETSDSQEEEDDTGDHSNYRFYILVDAYCINADGACLDASLLAVIACLLDTTVPKAVISSDGSQIKPVNKKTERFRLNMCAMELLPFSCSFGLVHGKWICDLSAEEEQLREGANVTITTSSSGVLYGIQMSGGEPVSDGTVQNWMKLSQTRAKAMQKLIEKTMI